MAHLPFTAVMSGLTLHWIAGGLTSWRSWDRTRMTLAGLALGIGLGWLWTGAVSYIPTPVGPGAALAHDEFAELVARWQPQIQPGDTLFVLPQTDSTPQLHPMTGLPPPGRWIKGWRWYFRPDFVLETLTAEWQADPPTWIAVFPDLIEAGGPGILTLLDIVDADYALQFTSGDIYHHGSAQIYRLPGLIAISRMMRLCPRGKITYDLLSLMTLLLCCYGLGFMLESLYQLPANPLARWGIQAGIERFAAHSFQLLLLTGLLNIGCAPLLPIARFCAGSFAAGAALVAFILLDESLAR